MNKTLKEKAKEYLAECRITDRILFYGVPTDLNTAVYFSDILVLFAQEQIGKKKRAQPVEYDLSFIQSDKWKALVTDWINYKRIRREAYKDSKQVEIFFKRLLKLSNNSYEKALECVEQSIANNYSGIHTVKKIDHARESVSDKLRNITLS